MKAKKHLGQHFLIDQLVVDGIIDLIEEHCSKEEALLEVGPGPGVLTYRLADLYPTFKAVEFDRDMVAELRQKIDDDIIIQAEFLSYDMDDLFDSSPFNLVGNFPYNISSQIIFKMLDNRARIPVMVGMFQKEVAERICSTPGGKTNGILSLRTQAFYDCHKAFDISPEAFDPPPRVMSSVIVLKRKEKLELDCDQVIFERIIKMSFQQRRKKLRNTLKSMITDDGDPIFQKRPEQLSVADFVNIANKIKPQ